MITSPETKLINNKASHNALIAAIYCFLASKERGPGFTGPDDMAYVFLPLKAIFFPLLMQGKCSCYFAEELTEIVKKGGEALSFRIEEGEIKEFLASKGFAPLLHYSPQLFETKYLYDDNGELSCKVCQFENTEFHYIKPKLKGYVNDRKTFKLG
jgi:hypothetical protein